MKNILTLIFIFSFSLSACAEDIINTDGINWFTNLEEAKLVAADDDLPIFIHFTGSDWCGWCKKLENEVYKKKDFQVYAENNLIMVKIDFPKYTSLPAEIQEYNNNLARAYGITGFPTVVLLNSQGEEIARTGYQYGGSAKYIEHIKNLLGQP